MKKVQIEINLISELLEVMEKQANGIFTKQEIIRWLTRQKDILENSIKK